MCILCHASLVVQNSQQALGLTQFGGLSQLLTGHFVHKPIHGQYVQKLRL